MATMTANEIRKKFLDFFASKGHTIVPSAPMVIKDDPTLMFTNAGMNQFKDIFLGNAPKKWKRATDSQKCLRVSGKHNDLEEVGHDTYHQTMFEMLGNWSFGDYFKNEAIDWAWELLTDVYGIDRNLLYATVFEGSKEDGTGPDMEARTAWLRHLPEDHILYGNKHDNFWEMGDTGPCGPCSEIHIDIRSAEEKANGVPARELVNKSDPHVIEIWNIVFMQYMRMADGHLENLPEKNIDTGMGFERLCAVLQGKNSNYDTDVFSGLLSEIGRISGHGYGESEKTDVAMRVIADHVRAIAFSIADGQLPSNVKAGYVIRRILRRAVRYGYTFLGLKEPFLCRLIPGLVHDMGEAYPELKAQQKLIESVTREEELAFLRTLDRGIRLMDDYMEKNVETKVIPGKDAFVLYDTFGFPIDLTELIATENGYQVDLDGFGIELDAQKQRARHATSNEFGDWTQYAGGESQFVGYDTTEVKDAVLLRQRTVVQKGKTHLQLVFDRTPFYGEMGGEIGDTGYIVSADGEKIAILDTIRENGLILHLAERLPQNCTGPFVLHVDESKRHAIENNHSCTHLLDEALREILGNHVEQKGSYVSDTQLRFDFSHFEKLSDEQIHCVEQKVNSFIRADYPLEEKRDTTMEEAKELGAIALFGEKYGERVRVVKFGPSAELCGGCHVKSTGRIGFFKIVSESAIAAGVRRIVAVTGPQAEDYVYAMQNIIRTAREAFGGAPDLVAAISRMVNDNAQFKKQAEEFARKKTSEFAKLLAQRTKEVGGVNLIVVEHSTETDFDPVMIREAAGLLQKNLSNTALVAAFEYSGKPQLALMYSQDLVEKGRDASADIRIAAKSIQGGGGGSKAFAMAGGRNAGGLKDALDTLVTLATS